MLFAETLPWGQFGLAGLVIGTLCSFVLFLVKQHHKERTEILDRHLGERKEWREDAHSRTDQMQKVISSLETAIKDQAAK